MSGISQEVVRNGSAHRHHDPADGGDATEADLAVVSNRMNQVMKRMTSWGAILLGSTLIAGIYGMNFKDIPELNWTFGYPLALGSMLALTIFLYTWFKRRNWL